MRRGSIVERLTGCLSPVGDDVANPAGERKRGMLPEYDFLIAGDGRREDVAPDALEPGVVDRSWLVDDVLRIGMGLAEVVAAWADAIGAGAGIFIADGGGRATLDGSTTGALPEDELWLLALLTALSCRARSFLRPGRRSAASSHLRPLDEPFLDDDPLACDPLLEMRAWAAASTPDW